MIGTHKRGDTFDYSDRLVMTDEGVELPSLVGMVGASQLRHAGDPEADIAPDTLIANLDFIWLDAAQGLFRVRHSGSTAAWPLGVLLHDVQLTTPTGDVISTATERIKLVQDITHG
jgi:hypothetical protein